MICLFVQGLVDAAVIMGLLAAFNDDQLEFSTGLIIGLITAFFAGVFNYVATLIAIGIVGEVAAPLVGLLLGNLGVGILLSMIAMLFFGMEIKRALLVGVIFAAFRIVMQFSLAFAFATAQ